MPHPVAGKEIGTENSNPAVIVVLTTLAFGIDHLGMAIAQVFLNLIINASQAIPDRGTILIETAEQGNVAVVVIEDDGDGIPNESIQCICYFLLDLSEEKPSC